MKVSTKNLASLLVVSAVALVAPGITRLGNFRRPSKFDRILQRHDRKGELRASLLGVEPHVFRSLQRKLPLEEIVKRHGFSDSRQFRLALCGKLKDELRQRGWSSRRIDKFVAVRSDRAT